MWLKTFIAAFVISCATSCQPGAKPVEITETGWIITCSDKSDRSSSAHGLPFMLFQTQNGGHFDTFTFSSNNVPPCETWLKRDLHELDENPEAPRDYEISVVQHMNWRGNFDGTWDLIKMQSLSPR